MRGRSSLDPDLGNLSLLAEMDEEINIDELGQTGPAERTDGDLVQPSLLLQEFEGRVHSYEGLLSRKTKLKKWKKRWFRVAPGRHQEHMFYLTQSKSTKHFKSAMEKRIIAIPKLKPNLRVEPISADPTSQLFTAFNVYDSRTKELLHTFRADDIVQQRNFMAALTGKGPGLFTQHSDNTLEETVVIPDSPDSLSSGGSSELLMRQLSYDRMSNRSLKGSLKPPSYGAVMVRVPKEYYSPVYESNNNAAPSLSKYPGQLLPVYNVSNLPPSSTLNMMRRRLYDDTFLPPHGPPVHNPTSIGYGSEVGLKDNQQALWDPSRDIYFFLDHSVKTVFLDDPRPLESFKPTVTRKEISCKSLPIPFPVSNVDKATSKSCTQSQKPHGLVLSAAGSQGVDGLEGQTGRRGKDGYPGDIGTRGDGEDGESGLNGGRGEDGSPGKGGSDGGNLVVTLTGCVSKLHINVNDSMNTATSLGDESCDEVVFVNCRGGNGGNGGKGGDGGKGGCGGDGGEGTHRGDGGHGGDGGMGGNGGASGSGGKAGNGGNCVIQTTDASLLMLVEVDCRAGTPGKGAPGGRGGEGGAGGFGGQGATWEEASRSSSGQCTVRTVSGLSGKPGMSGSSGMSGTAGSDGVKGDNGGVLWVVKSESGEVVHQASERYDLEVTGYAVTPGNSDGIYEPNQQITVTDVTILNSGGLPVPAGAKVTFPSSDTVRFEPIVYTLPELPSNETFVVPETFRGRIFDQATPTAPGPLNTEVHISSKVSLLGRSFDKSVVKKTLPVCYPIKLSFALSKDTVSCGEVSTLDIGIENISQVTYGTNSSDSPRGGVYLRVHMDTRLLPLGVYSQDELPSDAAYDSLSYAVTYDPSTPDSLFIHIKEIQPGETLVIPIVVLMESLAELCDTCVWQVDLCLKGKLIEYKSQSIRVSPAYSPPANPIQVGDILMIVNEHLKREQLTLLQRIFTILSVNVDYWDASHSKHSSDTPLALSLGAATGDTSSPDQYESKLPHFYRQYSGKTILYPHCHFDDIPAKDIVAHLSSGNESESQDSSMLLFLLSTSPDSLEDYTLNQSGDSQVLRHLCSSEKQVEVHQNAYSGYHFLPPGTLISTDWTVKRSEKNTMKKIERGTPSQAVVLVNSTKTIQHCRPLRYSYGVLDVRRCPLLRSSNFQCVDGAGGSLLSVGSDDPLLTPSSREFPLASKFGQVFLAIMCALPLRCKLTILKKTENKSSPYFVKFHLPNGLKIVKQELAAICIANEVADELLNCSGNVSRMQYVIEDLEANKSLCTTKPTCEIIVQLMDLIATEVAERKKTVSLPIVVQAAKEIQRLCNSCSILNGATICQRKLPQLKLLQDSSRVLRSHQLLVDEDRYNISHHRTTS